MANELNEKKALFMDKDFTESECLISLGYMVGSYLADPEKYEFYLLNIPKLAKNAEAVKFLESFSEEYPDAPFYDANYDVDESKEEEE